MSVAELAMQMGISQPKAYELAKAPGFPIIRVGSREGAPKSLLLGERRNRGMRSRRTCRMRLPSTARDDEIPVDGFEKWLKKNSHAENDGEVV